MKLGICLHHGLAHGGREHNARAIADEALARGHALRLYCWRWDGALPQAAALVQVPRSGLTNHTRARRFAEFVCQHRAARPLDLLLGFHPMPGLDACYMADHGLGARLARQPWRRWLPRYRVLGALEHAALGPTAATRILALSTAQLDALRAFHGTQPNRCELLPPELRADRAAAADRPALRRRTRALLGIDIQARVVLALGSGYHTKGLDRTLRAFAHLPPVLAAGTWLLVVGQGEEWRYRRLAEWLGIAARTRFLGARDDVPALLAASDLLLHPARREATGMALLEAASAGVPVLASGACGYAPLVAGHGFGQVLEEPFNQAELELRLQAMLGADAAQRAAWAANGMRCVESFVPGARARRVLDLLEAMAHG